LIEPSIATGALPLTFPCIDTCAGADEFFYGIDGVETFTPEELVVPGVLADGQRHLLAAKAE
jgi:hypothetical protein